MCGHNTTNLGGVFRLSDACHNFARFKSFVSTYEPWTDACDCPINSKQGSPCDFGMLSSFIMCLHERATGGHGASNVCVI